MHQPCHTDFGQNQFWPEPILANPLSANPFLDLGWGPEGWGGPKISRFFFFPLPPQSAGVSHGQPESPNVDIRVSRRFKHHQNSTRRPPRERRKKDNCGGRGKKKRAPHRIRYKCTPKNMIIFAVKLVTTRIIVITIIIVTMKKIRKVKR